MELLSEQKVHAGDIIIVDKSKSKVNRLGRSLAFRANDVPLLPAVHYMATPEGELEKLQKVTHTLLLHDIDGLKSRIKESLGLVESREISAEIRNGVDVKIAEWKKDGRRFVRDHC